MIKQAPNKIVLVSPDYFSYNNQTAETNSFQRHTSGDDLAIRNSAMKEFTDLLIKLRANNINYYSFNSLPNTPDAVFPNNWFSTHDNNKVVLYPMYAVNRRLERNKNIINFLTDQLKYKLYLDLTENENKGIFLEGTGSMVIHYPSKTAFACISPRTDEKLFFEFCQNLNYKPVLFNALDYNKKQIYHTNVVMSIATHYAVICTECINDKTERLQLLKQIKALNLEIIEISIEQMNNFCANIFEVYNKHGQLVTLMSYRAFSNFSNKQIDIINKKSEILHFNIPSIETYGGGSLRCMIAGLH